MSRPGSAVANAALVEALDGHERRRDAGVPTVSVLAGPIGLALREGNAWAESRGRPVVRPTSPDHDAVISAWAVLLAATHELPRAAVAWLARRVGRPDAELAAHLRRMTPYERDTFLEAALADVRGSGQEHAVRCLLADHAVDRKTGHEVTAPNLSTMIGHDGAESTVQHVTTILLGLIPPAEAPAILISYAPDAAEPDGPGRERWAQLATQLVEAEPRLAVLLAADPASLNALLRRAPLSRSASLLRESVVPIPTLDADALRRRLDLARPGLADALAGPVARLAADGSTAALADDFATAARGVAEAAAGDPEAGDRARSAAERFLFERLESLPATAGLFRLNARPGHGPGPAPEVDLLADARRLAVEIDGYYHFRDAESYRRDRRKDLGLQRRGYLVVRVLADDVVCRLEEILDTILGAVAHQASALSTPRS